MKKFILYLGMVSVLMLSAGASCAQAEETPGVPLPSGGAAAAAAPEPAPAEDELDITAKAAVVMDAETGKVIISKNMFLRLPPASTTKVMSAVVALENSNLADTFVVSGKAASTAPSKVYLRSGDEITVEALLYSLMLKSANDSAVALAEGVAGSEYNFARMMTEKARSIGAFNTNFKNASGLPAGNHYTTAYDLALIMRYALKDQRFVDISSTRFATLNMGEKEKMLLKNHNRLLWYYDGAGPGKTGFTLASRHCYVGEANCNNIRLIVTVLRSYSMWDDAKKLLDKGFELSMTGRTLALKDKEPELKKASYKKSKKSSHKKKRRPRKRRI